jgi:Holliday junction DNA helicase RuvA
MISYLKGKSNQIQRTSNNRLILILEVNQIAYEIQIPSRLARQLSANEEKSVQIFTHLQIREEQPLLYGFATASERDLFRHLISISGIGAQLAIALIDTLGLEELLEAILTNNSRVLCKSPGVGKKTAERIILELQSKLCQWREGLSITVATTKAVPTREILEELEMTLLALGYTKEEIDQAISAITQDSQLLKNTQVEEWLRKAIAWLSSEV